MVGSRNWPSHRQFSRRIHLACQDVGDGITAFFSRLPSAKNGIRITAPRSSLDDGTRVDDNYNGLSNRMEGLANIENELFFVVGKVEFGCNIPINAFSSLTTDGYDGSICLVRFVVDEDRTDGNFWIFLLSEHFQLIPFSGVTLSLEFHLGKVDVFAIDVCQGF